MSSFYSMKFHKPSRSYPCYTRSSIQKRWTVVPTSNSNYVHFWFLLDITLILNQQHKRHSKLHPSACRWASQLINPFHNTR